MALVDDGSVEVMVVVVTGLELSELELMEFEPRLLELLLLLIAEFTAPETRGWI